MCFITVKVWKFVLFLASCDMKKTYRETIVECKNKSKEKKPKKT